MCEGMPTNDEARRWVEERRQHITNEEIPNVLRLLLDLLKFALAHNQQIQIEAAGQEMLLLEIIGVAYRIYNLDGQVIGSDKLLELLEQQDDGGI